MSGVILKLTSHKVICLAFLTFKWRHLFSDLSVSDYFTKLRVIWDELDNFRPDNVCTCNGSSVIAQRKREDQAMQFLCGLNDQYNNIKAHVLLMEHVPTITKIFSLVVQQEQKFNSSVLVAHVKYNNFVIHTNVNFVTCSFRGKLRHNETVCFKKNGYPNQDGKGSRSSSNNKKVCTYYNKNGHTVDVFYKKHGYPLGYRFQNSNFSHANIVAQEDIVGGQDHNKNAGSGDFRITQSQFQILSYFLKNVSVSNIQAQVNQVGFVSADPQNQNSAVTGNLNRFQNVILNKHAWILDFGATILVCFDISNFTSFSPIKPINIKLPNGNSVIASYSGTIFSRINLFWKMSYMCQIFF